MSRKRKKTEPSEDVDRYIHEDRQRRNNPPVGLVTPDTDVDLPKKEYSYDPHIDPQLVWTGKKEGSGFEIDTVSLHIHEQIDPLTIIEKAMRPQPYTQQTISDYFRRSENNPPISKAIEFYKHEQGWSNRLIAGDSLLVMNSLLEKEGMTGKVQMIYIDPPYGIKYGSNFQPFVNRRDVKDGNDDDLSQDPETIKAFRDTWELGIHSYLTYLRDRLLLAKELLSESGSCFVQINDQNLHLVRIIMDEIFLPKNFVNIVTFKKTGGQSSKLLAGISDYLIWYAKDKDKMKFRFLFKPKILSEESGDRYSSLELANGKIRPLTREEKLYPNTIPKGAKPFSAGSLLSEGAGSNQWVLEFNGKKYKLAPNKHWKIAKEGIAKLIEAGRIFATRDFVNYKQYLDDFPYAPISNLWADTMGAAEKDKRYVVQTSKKILQRCILMCTDPGDLVFDPTCGSGTTAFVAEQWGRRWITCDTSRVATTLTKQRLMTAKYDYYELRHSGLGGGVS